MSVERNPWQALGALCVGFFMILLDMTIVAVANPAIASHLQADMNSLVWVTSAYLLVYAVPLLVTGRLGDRFGPKNLYLAGLTVFTVASLWCGLAGSIGMLIAARAVQGLGAALMAPQTMAVITRIFPADKRGAALGAWGSVAGVATLVGPLLGGVLVDRLGWEWIFIVNVPVGVVAFALAVRYVPTLPTTDRKFDVPGVLLSGVGMSLLVFGIQEGNTHDWSAMIWALIAAGIAVMAVFVVYQWRFAGSEPLVPLTLFKDRNFALSNVAIASLGGAITGIMLPSYFYLQAVRDYSSTKSALVFAPMAVVTGFLAPVVGKFIDRLHPRYLPTAGFAMFALSMFWMVNLTYADSSILAIMGSSALMGLGSACIWAPLAAVATRNLPLHQAGAGSGIYNTTRQVGSVLGSAAIGALLTARLSANLPPGVGVKITEGSSGGGHLPANLVDGFCSALRESMWLPIGALVVSAVTTAFYVRNQPAPQASRPAPQASEDAPVPAGA
ncbi:MAG: DHA2 family efflux MFS transporter permease subunit [Mycobacteriaceae bacterium]|nr:DHA2 family efflux MFS transporter permease subunit [Mycobacteriaceae bacterium]